MLNKTKQKENKPKDVKLSRVFYHYWKYGKQYKWQYLFMALGFIVGSLLMFVINPLYYRDIVNLMNEGAELEKIWSVFLIIIGIVIIANILFRIADFLMTKYQLKGMIDLNDYVFVKTIEHSNSFFENNFTGSLVNKLNKFVLAYEHIMDIFIFGIFFSVGQAITAIIILFFT